MTGSRKGGKSKKGKNDSLRTSNLTSMTLTSFNSNLQAQKSARGNSKINPLLQSLSSPQTSRSTRAVFSQNYGPAPKNKNNKSRFGMQSTYSANLDKIQKAETIETRPRRNEISGDNNWMNSILNINHGIKYSENRNSKKLDQIRTLKLKIRSLKAVCQLNQVY